MTPTSIISCYVELRISRAVQSRNKYAQTPLIQLHRKSTTILNLSSQDDRRYQISPRCAFHNEHPVFIIAQNLVRLSAVMLLVFYCGLGLGSLSESMTSSTKPEVHNVSQRRQRRTEPRPQETWIKLDEDRSYGFRVMRADRQTDRQT